MMSFEQDDFDENEQPCCLNPDIFTNDDGIRSVGIAELPLVKPLSIVNDGHIPVKKCWLADVRNPNGDRSVPGTVITNINADARDMPLNPKNRRYFRAWPKFKDP